MILVILFLICSVYLLFYKSKRHLHMLQQNLYNENNRYGKWLFKNYKLFIDLDIIVLIVLLIGSLVELDSLIANILLLVISIIALIVANRWNINIKNDQNKKPLVITPRIKRLLVTTTIIYLIPIVLLCINYKDTTYVWLMLFIFFGLVYLNSLVLLLANYINVPVEALVTYHFYHMATNKLKSMPNLKVVGITGSYGKTSSKNILSDILNVKYNAFPTPKNLNTPKGTMIAINNHLDKFDEIFISEMGAYKRGEIKELCDFVHPKYGILTRIGTAHLATFGSQENIQKGKFELIESLPEDGFGVLNGDDPLQVSYKLKNKVKVIWIGIDNKDVDVRATNIKCNNRGTNFEVIFKNDSKKYKFETKLLGKHNVYNILAGIAMGREFGISIDELQTAVRGVRAVEHRLELKRLGNFYQIDDAYNSNPVGAKSALEVLKMMPGVKVVVTPGMIELGEEEEKLNHEFGKEIAAASDYVVLIGEKQTKPIMEGLKEEKFAKDKIIVLNDVRKAYEFINGLAMSEKKEVYALFENDLPDTYNE
ncbi:MAG: UDP-N-acetylmuramoyl-tripeptide--D-alanyl-D-alanine ligase [Bacilli bacterium]|nr:UDP-N-acetylmuramoyl-tripeptide--D-alanyl-D-alanine ligase [Bacilli bacterium]